MTLSDKVRRAAFTLAVGSIGVGIGYIGNDVVKIVRERISELAAKKETYQEPMDKKYQYYVKDYHSNSGIIYFDGGFAF